MNPKIKLVKENPDAIVEFGSKESSMIMNNLVKRIRDLELTVERNSRKKVQHLDVIQKQAWHWIVPNETHAFNYESKYSGDIQFIIDIQLSNSSAKTGWISVELEANNTSINEKNTFLFHSHHAYANNVQTHPVMAPLSLKRIENLKKGQYQMKVIFTCEADTYLMSRLTVYTKR